MRSPSVSSLASTVLRPASAAVAWAADQARLLGRGLTLVHALMPPVTTGGLGVSLPPSLDLLDELEKQARDQLAGEAAKLDAPTH